MSSPTVPTWDSAGSNLTVTTGGHQTNGYAVNEVPSSGELNYFMRQTYLCLAYMLTTRILNGDYEFTDDVDIDGTLNVDGAAEFQTTLEVDGNARFDADVEVYGNLIAHQDITVLGQINQGVCRFPQGFHKAVGASAHGYSGGVHFTQFLTGTTLYIEINAPLLADKHVLNGFDLTFSSSAFPSTVSITRQRFNPNPVITTVQTGSGLTIASTTTVGTETTRVFTLDFPLNVTLDSRFIVNIPNASGSTCTLYNLVAVYDTIP